MSSYPKYTGLYRFWGLIVSAIYGLWIVIGFKLNLHLWIIFIAPIPVLLVIYLMWDFYKYKQNKRKEDIVTESNPDKDVGFVLFSDKN